MYSNTHHGMSAYNPYSSGHHQQRNNEHLHPPSQPLYSYSQPAMEYPYSTSATDQHAFEYGYTIVPFMPTPDALSRYEYNKTPSGQVVVTQGNQTVEFFQGVANVPSHSS